MFFPHHIFSIKIEYEDLQSSSPNPVRMWENMDQEISGYGHFWHSLELIQSCVFKVFAHFEKIFDTLDSYFSSIITFFRFIMTTIVNFLMCHCFLYMKLYPYTTTISAISPNQGTSFQFSKKSRGDLRYMIVKSLLESKNWVALNCYVVIKIVRWQLTILIQWQICSS